MDNDRLIDVQSPPFEAGSFDSRRLSDQVVVIPMIRCRGIDSFGDVVVTRWAPFGFRPRRGRGPGSLLC